MADNQLTTASGSGSQTTTQSPQAVGQSVVNSTQSSSVQPGTATNLLNGQGGVPLHGTALSTVDLNATAPATAAVVSTPQHLPKHHLNPTLLSFPGLLIIVAVGLFWFVSRSEKNTT